MEDWPPGFRFYPTEEELVNYYLKNKVEGSRDEAFNRLIEGVIPVVDIYDYNPWELPQFSANLCYKDPEQWFFFVPWRENEARGGRPSRLTTMGFWKATGSPGQVFSSNMRRPIGGKRTMVFYNGRAPHGSKTEWRMNEYTALDQPNHHHRQASSSSSSSSNNITAAPMSMTKQDYNLCRVYKKSSCIRSFDRRPPPPPLRGLRHPPLIQPSQENYQCCTTLDQNPNDPTAGNRSLPSSDHSSLPSSSGDRNNTMTTIDDAGSWDWGQLDFFLGDEL